MIHREQKSKLNEAKVNVYLESVDKLVPCIQHPQIAFLLKHTKETRIFTVFQKP